jgi:hypothetical protein
VAGRFDSAAGGCADHLNPGRSREILDVLRIVTPFEGIPQ